MAITPSTPGSVDAPNVLTPGSAGNVDAPNVLTDKAAVSPVAPNALSTQAKVDPSAPNVLTPETVGNIAVPIAMTSQSVASPVAPNALSSQSAVSPGAPNVIGDSGVAGLPRALEPLVGMNFAEQLYVQDNRPIEFDDLFTYTRNSNASFWNRRLNRNGKWETFLDTDIVGNVTNLVTYSEQMDHADWVKSNTVVVANQSNNFNGDKVADKLYPLSTGTLRGIHNTVTLTTSDHAVSFDIKADGFDWVQIIGAAGSGGVWFNVLSGIIGSISGSYRGKIEYIGNGYYRCHVTGAGAVAGFAQVILADSDNTTTATVNGVDGVLISRSQVALGSKPLPYVKTASASAFETFTESLRFEYDPITAEAKGALVEGASTNLFLRSEEFDNASWTKSNATITANDSISPDETTSADKLAAGSTATINPQLSQLVTSVATNVYSSSFYVKKSEAPFVQIYFGTGHVANNPRVNFDLTNGALGTQDVDIDDATITDVGNGMYRITATITVVGTSLTTVLSLIKSTTDTRAQTSAWTAGDGVHVWGAQCENLLFASSYIRAEGSTVAKAADNQSISAVGNLPIPDKTYSVVGEFDLIGVHPSGAGTNQHVFNVLGESTRYIRAMDNTTGGAKFYHSAAVNGSVLNAHQQYSYAMVANDANILAYMDSSLIGTIAKGIVNGSATVIEICSPTQPLWGHQKKMSIYEEAMTAQEVSLL